MWSPSFLAKIDDIDQTELSSVEWTKLLIEVLDTQYKDTGPIDLIVYRNLYFMLEYRYGKSIEESFTDYVVEMINKWCENISENNDDNDIEMTTQLKSISNLRLNEMYENSIMKALHVYIESHVSTMLHNSYEERYTPEVKSWLEVVIFPFVNIVFADSEIDAASYLTRIEQKKHGLLHFMYIAIARLRTNELFEIIADFPDSIEAIRELRDMSSLASSSCSLSSSSSSSSYLFDQAYIGKTFRKVLCKRLLHSGASTSQILDMYVSMIRALRVLDSSDLLLNYVAAPIRPYLKNRRDTVQCIVSSLSLGKESDLHLELRKGGSLEYGQDEDFEDPVCAENWEPRKRNPELNDATLGQSGSGLDVLALLVSIYGSTDVFVSEYRNQLAEKLLIHNSNYLIDNDVMTLENLKKRFGDESLHSCEVMLHDIEESKRTNNQIASAMKAAVITAAAVNGTVPQSVITTAAVAATTDIDFAIISYNYWPQLSQFDNDDDFQPHPTAVTLVEVYHTIYSELKKPRKLNILPHIGQVQLALEFDDGRIVKNFSVSPIQATLIMYVSDKNEIFSTELAALTNLRHVDVQKKMSFWVSAGVIDVSSFPFNSNRSSIKNTGDSNRNMSNRNESNSSYVSYYKSLDTPRQNQYPSSSKSYSLQQSEEEGDGSNNSSAISDVMIVENYDDTEMMMVDTEVSSAHSKDLLDSIETRIVGMLASKGSVMSLERIHNMLTMIAAASSSSGTTTTTTYSSSSSSSSSSNSSNMIFKFDMNYIELQRFLQGLVSQEKLDCIDGMYSNILSRK